MSGDRELGYRSATDLVEAYRRKTLSPVEVTKAVLGRLERLEPKLNAFTHVDPESALAAARESEARWAKGAPKGLVDGVPTTVKDLLLTRGWPTMRGTRLAKRDQDMSEDSPAVARLREHGAVLIGKTTTPEYGWKALGDSPLTGITRNPWSLDHTPGGSSAGAAASLAAGIGALAIGTDGGGSIRIPCAFTGLPGLKATFGRIPAYPPSAMGLLSHVGPMARTVGDVALMLNVLAGTDPRDPYRLPAPAADFRDGIDGGLRGLRIAYSRDLGYAKVDPEVAAAVDRAVAALRETGAAIEAADPGFASPREAFLVLWSAGAARVMAATTAAERALMDPGFAATIERGAKWSAVEYLDADAARTELGQKMGAFHQTYDLLLTPTVAVPALPVGQDLTDAKTERHWIDWTPFSYPFNMTRQPAATVPCGLTKAGLPIGLQIVGRLYEEHLVLRAARAYEATRPAVWPALD
ncbi:MAG: amidase [Alphaproteobacteria bacterium]|nr:amidase [Alphaproteobacteria bacterium]